MKNILKKDFGRIVYYRDFTEVIRYSDGYVDYIQTNDRDIALSSKMYNQRIVGIHKTRDDNLVIGVAVASATDPNVNIKSGTQVVISRIVDLVNKYEFNMLPNLRGCTVVPKQFMHLLISDPLVYNNISGPLDLDNLLAAVKELEEIENKFIRKQISICYSIRAKELQNA